MSASRWRLSTTSVLMSPTGASWLEGSPDEIRAFRTTPSCINSFMPKRTDRYRSTIRPSQLPKICLVAEGCDERDCQSAPWSRQSRGGPSAFRGWASCSASWRCCLNSGRSFRRIHLTIREIYFSGVLSLLIIPCRVSFVGLVLGHGATRRCSGYGSADAVGADGGFVAAARARPRWPRRCCSRAGPARRSPPRSA